MQLKIEKLATDGKGIARTNNGIVFVTGALPGETAEVEIIKRKREYSVAKVIHIIEPSKYRTNPICPFFYECGGCQIQHLTYPFQLETKASFIEESLLRIGKIKMDKSVLCEASPKIWNYRNKASFPVKNLNGKVNSGFYAASSHDLVVIDSCSIIHEKLNSAFSIIKENIQKLSLSAYDEKHHTGALRHIILRTNGEQVLVSFVINAPISVKQRNNIISLAKSMYPATFTINENMSRGNAILGRKTEIISGSGYLEAKVGHHTLKYDTTSFFQVNTEQAKNLYNYACSFIPEDGNILELYCGIGSITMSLAEKSRQVTAVEEWAEAVDSMKLNIEINKISNVTPVCSNAERYISSDETMFDAVLLDPPRSGCDEKVISGIISKNIPKIIYISCNPAALARDLKKFADSGYIIDNIKAFDMFPHTSHVECCCVLSKERM
ncbi:MAG: 23S rRNA (uracil(1939)-C(5))-methyltransferase RlmD [Synergistaceae bacterium]|nr:23S rRNA (uracil(1939)-C(5))-methyltransferase RlmD [Synergistaceae bacterium]